MSQNKLLYSVALAIVAWALYTAVFDTAGNFDPTTELDVVEYRIGRKLGMVADGANAEIERQNRAAQGAVNVRERRIGNRVESDTTSP